MKKLLFILPLLLSGFAYAQTTLPATENYIYEKNCLTEDCSKKTESVQYFDGLGRVKQSISIKATPTGKDIALQLEYDAYGRQVKSYLPVPQSGTQNGGLYTDPLANATTVYGNEKIYTEKVLEASPLGRIEQQKQIGNAWAAHPVQFSHSANSSADAVKKYTVSTTWLEGRTNSELSVSGTYAAGILYKSTVTDEDGNVTTAFKNKKGQTILTRKNDGTQNVDTYYVYNEYNQLAYTLPPLASNAPSLSTTLLDNLCYQYRYDGWNRLVEKKIPGKGWEYMVYDKQDRLVLAQDANLRTTTNNFAAKGWMFTKYDSFGRVVYTGFFSNTASRAAMQTALNSMNANPGNNETRSTTSFALNGMDVYYTKNAFPTGSMKVLSVNYYDTYPSYSFNPAFPSTVMGKSIISDNSTANAVSTKGLPVMSFVKNIEDDNWTKSYSYYDTKGRMIGTYSINHLGGYTKTESDLDFVGVAKMTKAYHKRLTTDSEKIITQTYEYDQQNRLLVHKHKIDNNTEEILAQNEYNELSQLKNKKVGGSNATTPLQSIDYQYNIRGWMTQINDPQNLGNDLFGYKIKYNQVEGLQTPDASDTSLQVVPKYNGNIAEVDWKTAATSNESLKRYGYVYDSMNRLSAGFYQNDTNPSLREYYEKATYDLNGNVKTMKRTAQRMGPTAMLIDNLSYQYENTNVSNRLQKISETVTTSQGYPYKASPTDIGYDDNGNMTSYQDKGISSIQYNYLNLPKQITQNANVTNYTYRADGVKLKRLFGTVQTDYLDGFQYQYTQPSEDESGTMTSAQMKLRIIPTSEGYYDALRNMYFYNYTDHLGNVRLSYSDADGNGVVTGDIVVNECSGGYCNNYIITGEIEGVTNYYPFGMLLENHNYQATNSNAYKYKYNGKELQETGLYDYGWRQYMPDIGRWNGIDQLAEAYLSTSTYAYVANNPVLRFDVDGRWFNEDGTIDTSGHTPGFVSGHQYLNSFLGANNSYSGGGSGGYTVTGNNAISLFNYFKNGGNMDGISINKGYMLWGTVDDAENRMFYDENGELTGTTGGVTLHRAKVRMNDYDPSFLREFYEGARYADKSNFLSTSAFIGYGGLHLNKYEGLLKLGAKGSSISNLRNLSKNLKTIGKAGKYLGYVGVAASIVEDYSENKVGWGTVAKVGLGIALIYAGPIGLAYGVTDLAVGIVTGTTITDRIASGIDNSRLGTDYNVFSNLNK